MGAGGFALLCFAFFFFFFSGLVIDSLNFRTAFTRLRYLKERNPAGCDIVFALRSHHQPECSPTTFYSPFLITLCSFALVPLPFAPATETAIATVLSRAPRPPVCGATTENLQHYAYRYDRDLSLAYCSNLATHFRFTLHGIFSSLLFFP